MDDQSSLRQAFLGKIARDVNLLKDADRHKRKRAVDAIEMELYDSTNRLNTSSRSMVVLQDLQLSLLTVLSDSVEINRETTISLFTRVVEDDVACTSDALAALLPGLVARVGRIPLVEEAEELRLKLAQLLNCMLSRDNVAPALRCRVSDVSDVLRCLASDAFHSVKVAAAQGMVHLCRHWPGEVHAVMGTLVQAAVANLGHQRGPVRLVSLSALHALLPCGSESLPTLLTQTVLPALLALRFDRTASVRKQAATVLAEWLVDLPHHALAVHEPTLLYALCAFLGDGESSDVSEHTLAVLGKACRGRQAAVEAGQAQGAGDAMATDLAVAADAAAPDSSIHGYDAAASLAEQTASALARPGGHQAGQPGAGGEGLGHIHAGADSEGSQAVTAALAAGILPLPFHHRPAPSILWVYQRQLPSILSYALGELEDWTARVRLAAALSLRSLTVVTEGAMSAHLSKVLPVLITGSRDDDGDVRQALGAVGRLLGVYTAPGEQLQVLLPTLKGEVPGLARNATHAASTLAVLAALLSSMTPQALSPFVPSLASTLCLPHLAEHEPAALQQQLAQCLAFTVQTGVAGLPHPSVDGATLDALLLCCLHCQDTSTGPEVCAIAGAAEGKLAAALQQAGVEHMYASAIHRLLPSITSTCRAWSKGSHERRVFDTLLRTHRQALCGATTAQAQDALTNCVDTFVATCEISKEPELKVVQLALLDSFICGHEESGKGRQGDPLARGAPQTLEASMRGTAGDVGAATAGAIPESPSAPSQVVRAALQSSGDAHSVSHELVDAILGDGLAARLVLEVLLPNMVWRVGLVASTVRKAAVACLLSLVQRRLLPLPILEPIAAQHLLPSLTGAASDDDVTTRLMCVSAIACILKELKGTLDYDAVRAVYPELLKRLDDANDAVRAAACTALAAFATCGTKDALAGGPVEYTLETLLVHLDDQEGGMQSTVYEAILPLVRLDVVLGRRLVTAARAKHRHPGYCDRLLEYMDGLAGR